METLVKEPQQVVSTTTTTTALSSKPIRINRKPNLMIQTLVSKLSSKASFQLNRKSSNEEDDIDEVVEKDKRYGSSDDEDEKSEDLEMGLFHNVIVTEDGHFVSDKDQKRRSTAFLKQSDHPQEEWWDLELNVVQTDNEREPPSPVTPNTPNSVTGGKSESSSRRLIKNFSRVFKSSRDRFREESNNEEEYEASENGIYLDDGNSSCASVNSPRMISERNNPLRCSESSSNPASSPLIGGSAISNSPLVGASRKKSMFPGFTSSPITAVVGRKKFSVSATTQQQQELEQQTLRDELKEEQVRQLEECVQDKVLRPKLIDALLDYKEDLLLKVQFIAGVQEYEKMKVDEFGLKESKAARLVKKYIARDSTFRLEGIPTEHEHQLLDCAQYEYLEVLKTHVLQDLIANDQIVRIVSNCINDQSLAKDQ